MISTSPTTLEYPTLAGGSARELDPRRRAARLRAHGIEIERRERRRYLVRFPDGRHEQRRTFFGAEHAAHRYIDRTPGLVALPLERR
jgi:hypothetical protein